MNSLCHSSSGKRAFEEAVATLLEPDVGPSDVVGCVSDFVRGLGFDSFSFAIAPIVGYDGQAGIILTDYSSQLLTEYRSGACSSSEILRQMAA